MNIIYEAKISTEFEPSKDNLPGEYIKVVDIKIPHGESIQLAAETIFQEENGEIILDDPDFDKGFLNAIERKIKEIHRDKDGDFSILFS